MSGEHLTIDEVARHLRVKPTLIRTLLKKGELYTDDQNMISRATLEMFIKVNTADTVVYFIQMATSRHVKIGIAWDPRKRLNELRTGNPEKLALIAFTVVRDARKLEREFHLLLKDHRLEGEWFSAGPWLDRLLACRRGEIGMDERKIRRALVG